MPLHGEYNGVPMTTQLWGRRVADVIEVEELRREPVVPEVPPSDAAFGAGLPASQPTRLRRMVRIRARAWHQCAEGTRYCPHNPACPR